MSAVGTKQTCRPRHEMSAFRGRADAVFYEYTPSKLDVGEGLHKLGERSFHLRVAMLSTGRQKLFTLQQAFDGHEVQRE
jgi:hypothetical protein